MKASHAILQAACATYTSHVIRARHVCHPSPQAGAVRPALEDFRGVVMGVVEVVAEAGEVLQGQPQVLQRLVGARRQRQSWPVT